MNLDNNTKHNVKTMPVHNTERTPMPPHSDPKEGFTGEDMGVNGRMKRVTTSNNE